MVYVALQVLLCHVLKSNDIQISMDGKGRWVDNVMVERLWRSVKYEEVYLKAYSSVTDAKKQLSAYFEFYNLKRPHSSLDKMTPDVFTMTSYHNKIR